MTAARGDGRKSVEIRLHVGIGIFLNEQRARGVAHKDRQQPSSKPDAAHEVIGLIGKFIEALAEGGNHKGSLGKVAPSQIVCEVACLPVNGIGSMVRAAGTSSKPP